MSRWLRSTTASTLFAVVLSLVAGNLWAAEIKASFTAGGVDGATWRDPDNWNTADFPDATFSDTYSIAIDSTGGSGPFIVNMTGSVTGGFTADLAPSPTLGESFAIRIGANDTLNIDDAGPIGAFGNAVNLQFTGDLLNDGIINLQNEESFISLIRVEGDSLFTGSGAIVFDTAGANSIDNKVTSTQLAATFTIDTSATVRTSVGGTGSFDVTFFNDGLIDANGGAISLNQGSPGLSENRAMISARNGGLIENNFTLDNTSGVFDIDATSELHIGQGIDGGELRGDGTVRTSTSSFASVSDITLTDITVLLQTGDQSGLAGPRRLSINSTVNNGTIVLDDSIVDTFGSSLHISGDTNGEVNFTGTGDIIFRGASDNVISSPNTGTHNLILGSGQRLLTETGARGSINVNTTNNGLIEVDGGALASGLRTITNNARIEVNNGGTFAPGELVDNRNGVIDIDASSTFLLQRELRGGMIQGGGTIDITANIGAFNGTNPGGITLNDVTVNLDTTPNPNATKLVTLRGDVVNNSMIVLNDIDGAAGRARLNVAGDVNLTGAGEVVFGSAFINEVFSTSAGASTLTVGAAQILRVDAGNVGAIGVSTSNHGTLLVNGELSIGPALTNEIDGTIKGSGVINTDAIFNPLVNNGTLDVGNSPGALTIAGRINNGSTARHIVELGGLLPGEFDQLFITGAAGAGAGIIDLDGTLDIRLINGFLPAVTDVFDIILADTRIDGAFSNIISNRVEFDLGSFRVSDDGKTLSLSNFIAAPSTAVSAPTPMLLMLACLLLGLRTRRGATGTR